jgi:hypothetical protein
MKRDADGMERYDMTWTVEGRKSTSSGRLYEMHEAELENAKAAVRRLARRGDTVTMKIS